MGKLRGFLEFERIEEEHDAVETRVRHHKEFVHVLGPEQARVQGARCMDCGTPFCSHGCPVNNLIPDFNDLVYRDDWQHAIEVLHSTNNFPEFTGRICPAPCEAACTLNINSQPVGIKSIEHAIIERAWSEGWVRPQPAAVKTGRTVAVVGSGPAGLAASQQLVRAGHAVTLFEKNDRVGGLLRYGIPDFKLEKRHVDRRVEQLVAEGVQIRVGTLVGEPPAGGGPQGDAVTTISPQELLDAFDAVLLSGGAEQPRDLPLPGRELAGVHFALEFLAQQNRINAGLPVRRQIHARDKHVIVIGGGDTGADCVGTANRQAAASVVQFELMPMPPVQEDKALTWPYWPYRLRTSPSHEEGCGREFAIATRAFRGKDGRLASLETTRVEMRAGRPVEIEASRQAWPADLVLLALGFVGPLASLLDGFGVARDARGNARATTDIQGGYASSVPGVFVAGDMRRGQSLVVWAIREGRQAARAVDEYLMGTTTLPR